MKAITRTREFALQEDECAAPASRKTKLGGTFKKALDVPGPNFGVLLLPVLEHYLRGWDALADVEPARPNSAVRSRIYGFGLRSVFEARGLFCLHQHWFWESGLGKMASRRLLLWVPGYYEAEANRI